MDSYSFSPLEKKLLFAYILWEFCNLIVIKYAEFTQPIQVQCIVYYLAICVNTLVTMYFYMRYGRKRNCRVNLLAAGLFMTFVADFFLSLLNIRLPGFFAFCLVELIYAIYFKPSWRNVLIRISLFLILLIPLYQLGYFSLDNVFGLLNISLLTVNVFCAFYSYLQEGGRWRLCLALGFLFFAGCDYSILIRTLANGRLFSLAAFMIWPFYVPAQVLITLAYAGAVMLNRNERRFTMIRKKYLLLLLTLLFMTFIFIQSALPATVSLKESSPFAMVIAGIFHISEDTASFLVRKAAHFTEYLLLGICLFLTVEEWLRTSGDRIKSNTNIAQLSFWISWGIGTLYAVSDEFHQSFVPERSCELRDIFIDSAGVLVGILIIKLIKRKKSSDHSTI